MMNPDLRRGLLFRHRAKELFDFLKKQPNPYTGTDSELAEAIFIGERTIARYLRYLRCTGKIESADAVFKLDNGAWINRRKIVVVAEE